MNGYDTGSLTTNFTTTPNTWYTVTFDMAGNPGGDAIKRMEVSAAGQSQTYSFIQDSHTNADMGWTSQTFYFKANDSTATLQFKSLNALPFPELCPWGPALDNVNVVPLPPTVLLLGSGLVGLGLLRRKWSLKQ